MSKHWRNADESLYRARSFVQHFLSDYAKPRNLGAGLSIHMARKAVKALLEKCPSARALARAAIAYDAEKTTGHVQGPTGGWRHLTEDEALDFAEKCIGLAAFKIGQPDAREWRLMLARA